MANAAISRTQATGRDAGLEVGTTIHHRLTGEPPDALLVIATADQDHRTMLEALQERRAPGVIAGCRSAGEFTTLEGRFSGFHNCTAGVCVLPR